MSDTLKSIIASVIVSVIVVAVILGMSQPKEQKAGATASTLNSTTTLCAVQNPFNATSSLISAGVVFTTATTSAATIGLIPIIVYTVSSTIVSAQFMASSTLPTSLLEHPPTN
jgi:hypothetical protein